MISVRWRPSSWMQFSSLFFKIVHDTGQQLTIDRTNFLTDGFLQIIQRTGFVSVNAQFQIPPKKKKITRWKIGRARGPRHVSETGNEVPGKHVSNNCHWLVCSVRCGTILLKPHIGTVYSSSAQFWVLPIQKILGSRGSPCICVCVCVYIYIYIYIYVSTQVCSSSSDALLILAVR